MEYQKAYGPTARLSDAPKRAPGTKKRDRKEKTAKILQEKKESFTRTNDWALTAIISLKTPSITDFEYCTQSPRRRRTRSDKYVFWKEYLQEREARTTSRTLERWPTQWPASWWFPCGITSIATLHRNPSKKSMLGTFKISAGYQDTSLKMNAHKKY